MSCKVCGKCKHYVALSVYHGFCKLVEADASYFDYACKLSYMPLKLAKNVLARMIERVECETGQKFVIDSAQGDIKKSMEGEK